MNDLLPPDPFTLEETRAIVREWAREELPKIKAALAECYAHREDIRARMRAFVARHPDAGLVVPGD